MSDEIEDLRPDLRALCGGVVKKLDKKRVKDPVTGVVKKVVTEVEQELFLQADHFATICEVRRELELVLDDPDVSIEDAALCRDELKLVRRLQDEMERRMLDHFDTARPPLKREGKIVGNPCVGPDAKRKLMKAIADAKAGRYDRLRKSNSSQAARKAFSFLQKNGRMPSQGELKNFGFNDQEATDAGKWLEIMADPTIDEDSVFQRLPKAPPGRRPKK